MDGGAAMAMAAQQLGWLHSNGGGSGGGGAAMAAQQWWWWRSNGGGGAAMEEGKEVAAKLRVCFFWGRVDLVWVDSGSRWGGSI
jgi:hypothetical protein